MIDTIQCVSEADLTENFYRKLLTGAIDKREDKKRLEEQSAPAPHLEQASATARNITLPDRSASNATNVSRSFSETETLVAPSRGVSFPVETPLNTLQEEPAAENSTLPRIPTVQSRQNSWRPHSAGESDRTSPPTRHSFGISKRFSGSHAR